MSISFDARKATRRLAPLHVYWYVKLGPRFGDRFGKEKKREKVFCFLFLFSVKTNLAENKHDFSEK